MSVLLELAYFEPQSQEKNRLLAHNSAIVLCYC